MSRPWNEDDPWERAASRLSIKDVPPFAQRIVDLGRIDVGLSRDEELIVPDLRADDDENYSPVPGRVNRMYALDLAFVHSNLWVGELFEIVRILNTKIYPQHPVGPTKHRQKTLQRELSMVRIPLTKLLIQGRGEIHYPQNLIGRDGSLGWRVQDPKLNKHVFTRRYFREQFFELAHNYNEKLQH